MPGSDDHLKEYRDKRSFDKTPEPSGSDAAHDARSRFVIQEHHARRLHWDLRLERDGVLVSWALPRGIPDDPKANRLAVHTEDHPLEYLEFEAEIPEGEYGGGQMTIWDQGTYDAEKFRDDEVIAQFHGERMQGKFALFSTTRKRSKKSAYDDKDWLIHRMDPPEPGRDPMPKKLESMNATTASLPADDAAWGYEIKWDGVRALAYISPGHLEMFSRTGRDITAVYPEITAITRAVGYQHLVLDGEIVAFDEGRPSFQRLQPRMNVTSESQIRRLRQETPVTFIIFDVLYANGHSLLKLPYTDRRAVLDQLDLSGPYWQTPAHQEGDGDALLAATRMQGLEGIVAKRLRSTYQPGRRSRDWLKIKNTSRQEVVIGGWVPGEGNRSGQVGALVVGVYHDKDLKYVGKVGTGFNTATLEMLRAKLSQLEVAESPFAGRQPQKDTVFVRPELVCEVEFTEWTEAGTLRQPSYKGLRDDKPATDVVREEPS